MNLVLILTLVAVSCLLSYVGWESKTGAHKCVLPCVVPCFYLIHVFKARCNGTSQLATSTRVVPVEKRPICDPHLSSAPNTPSRHLTLHSDSRVFKHGRRTR